jgi:tRNA threonylcarbamoyladenosine biosynthesis protein TsaE
MESRTVPLPDAAATQAIGRDLAQRWLALPVADRPVLLLQGDLGAGKTCLAQGLAQGLEISEAITSPSFALAQHYQGEAGALVHLDLYRLEHSAAADELFAQEEEAALELGALLAVEWPERLSVVPEHSWTVQLRLRDAQNPDRGRLATLIGIAGLL